MNRKALRAIAALVLVAGCGSTGETTGSPMLAESEITVELDIAYGPDDRHRLDVIYPEDVDDAPTVVLVHGGGWSLGDKTFQHPTGQYLARLGFVVALPNYRLVEPGGVNAFPVPVEDVACASAWLAQNASDYGGDGTTMLTGGYSAGGHIAALLAVNPERDWLQDCPIQNTQPVIDGLIGFAGAYDMAVLLPENDACNMLHDLIGPECPTADPTLWTDANPVSFVDADDPPALLIGGDRDCIVSSSDPETGLCTASFDRMEQAYTAAGASVDVLVIPDGGHGDVGIESPPIRWAVANFAASLGLAVHSLDAPESSDPGFTPAASLAEVLPTVWKTSTNRPFAILEDGSWRLLAEIVRLPWLWGEYELDGDTLTLHTADDERFLCPGISGTYEVTVSEDGSLIHFALVDDPCEARSLELVGGPFEQFPEILIPGDLK